MTAPITLALGEFISGVQFADLPGPMVARIGVAFADCVAVMTAGANDPAPTLLRKVLAPAGVEASIIGGGRASAMDAAWINGAAAHALDFDDSARRGGHMSAVLVPAILAEAEAINATGAQMLAAYAAGFETMSELVLRDPGEHHVKGWHPTPVFGAVAAAAACASLRRLDPGRASMAIAISASRSGGIIANVGTMTKPLHAGNAAHAGVVSARLAEEGFTAATDAFEHAPGFLEAFSPAGSVIDVDSPIRAGREWRLCGDNRVGTKQYPLCYYTHRAIDGMLDLLDAHSFKAEDVERISINLSPRNATILRYRLPQTGLEAKFSVQFALACPVVAGRPGLSQLTTDFVTRPDVQALMKRVVVCPDERDDPDLPGYAIYDQVVVDMRDGRRLEGPRVNKVRGGPDLPLSREALWSKFDDCMRFGGVDDSRGLFERLLSLEQASDAAGLARQIFRARNAAKKNLEISR